MRVFETPSALDAACALDPCKTHRAFRFLPEYMPAGFRCSDCGQVKPFKLGGGTGYARTGEGEGEAFACYDCASLRERAAMMARGEAWLYLTGLPCGGLPASGEPLRITDWPGGLSFPVSAYWTGRHNWGGRVHFVRFTGPDGGEWSGRNLGDSQICRVRRLKAQGRGRVAVSYLHPDAARPAILARFPGVPEAESWIARQAQRDPAGVAAGHYGIDAPEALLNKGGR